MKFLKNLLKLIIILIVLALINRWYLGGFTKLEVKEQNMGPYTMAYVNFTGNYGKVGPSMTKVYEALSGAGITTITGAGVYYDDPAVVTGSELRSDVGAIIDAKDIGKLVANKDIKITTLTAGTKIVVEFPLKNSLSYMIGPMKAYPAITQYMKEKGYTSEVPMVELYDMVAKKIYYMTNIAK